MRVLAVWGTAGVLCSGVFWNYAWNFKWYGNIGGPPAMRELLVSRDQSIPSVWTRCCRGAVLFLFDVTWLPRSADKTYEAVCQKAVGFLGGQKELTEDVNESLSIFAVGSGVWFNWAVCHFAGVSLRDGPIFATQKQNGLGRRDSRTPRFFAAASLCHGLRAFVPCISQIAEHRIVAGDARIPRSGRARVWSAFGKALATGCCSSPWRVCVCWSRYPAI